MSAKTKIVVLHTKEVIYTVLFVVLAIVLAVLLFLMFGKDKKTTSFSGSPAKYHAGIYKSPITLDNNTFDVEVTVDEHEIYLHDKLKRSNNCYVSTDGTGTRIPCKSDLCNPVHKRSYLCRRK